MATRSNIRIKEAGGISKSVYVHYDGYPEYMLKTLEENYNTVRKVKKLLSFGDISSVEPCIDMCNFYSSSKWHKSQKVYNKNGEAFYALVETPHEPREKEYSGCINIYDNIEDYKKDTAIGIFIEYIYTFDADTKKWECIEIQ